MSKQVNKSQWSGKGERVCVVGYGMGLLMSFFFSCSTNILGCLFCLIARESMGGSEVYNGVVVALVSFSFILLSFFLPSERVGLKHTLPGFFSPFNLSPGFSPPFCFLLFFRARDCHESAYP